MKLVKESLNEEISYKDMEVLADEVKDFITNKGFDLVDEFEFLTRLIEVLYEGIDKKYDE